MLNYLYFICSFFIKKQFLGELWAPWYNCFELCLFTRHQPPFEFSKISNFDLFCKFSLLLFFAENSIYGKKYEPKSFKMTFWQILLYSKLVWMQILTIFWKKQFLICQMFSYLFCHLYTNDLAWIAFRHAMRKGNWENGQKPDCVLKNFFLIVKSRKQKSWIFAIIVTILICPLNYHFFLSAHTSGFVTGRQVAFKNFPARLVALENFPVRWVALKKFLIR